jgi:hypothetical protein
MKRNFIAAVVFLMLMVVAGCKKNVDDYGLRSSYAVYTTMTPTPIEAPTVTTSASGSQSIPAASFRVYVNMLYKEAVTATFTLTGTAVKGTHYSYTGDNTITIPANTRYVDVPVAVINNSLGTASSRTIILTLTQVSHEFEVGIGVNKGYVKSTYTITK